MTEPDTSALVECRNVSFGYDQRRILDDVSFTVPRGKVTALMGASGCGKTTVLRLIGGQARPQQGEVLSMARTWRTWAAPGCTASGGAGHAVPVRRLFTDLSVFDNVAFPLREHSAWPKTGARHRADEAQRGRPARRARLMPARSRVAGSSRALARAIALDPDLVMYDEPFAGWTDFARHERN